MSQNILVVSNVPGRFHVKIADVGISKVLNQGVTGIISPYMAPESIPSHPKKASNYHQAVRLPYKELPLGFIRVPRDQKADMWSVGCIMFALDQKTDLFTVGVPSVQLVAREELDRILPRMGLEADGIQLMEQLLQWEPSDRPTAEQALKSPWFNSV